MYDLEQGISKLERERRQCETRLSQLEAERSTVQARMCEIDSDIEHLRAALAIVQPKAKHRRDGAALVGEGNVTTIYEALRDKLPGGATKAEIARAAERNSGTVSHAIKALVERGQVQQIGEGRGARFVPLRSGRSIRVRAGETS